ncbi:MAG: hypothetical protein ACXWP4_23655, partial [Polyangiales bacterium]
PTKPKPFIPLAPLPADAKKQESKGEKSPAVDLGFVPSGPTASHASLFGPGVSGAVFGNASPNIAGMSDQQLVAKTRELVTAMRTKSGQVNEEDWKTLGALQKELAARVDARLSPKVPPEAMTNQELGKTLFMFDLAKASGMKLTKEQEAWYAKANDVWQKRLTVNPEKALVEINAERQKVTAEVRIKCAGALLGTAGLVTHFEAASLAASLLAGSAAWEKHDFAGVAKEMALFGMSKMKGGEAIEAISVVMTADECNEAKEKLEWLDQAAAVQQQKLKGGK